MFIVELFLTLVACVVACVTLTVNEHIDRVCEVAEHLENLRALLLDGEHAANEEDDSNINNDVPLPGRIANKFQRLLTKYEGCVLELRSALQI